MSCINQVRNYNRSHLIVPVFAVLIAAAALVLTAPISISAGPKPPTPANFRVTAQTAYTVTVAWDAPRNNAGNFNYHLSGTSRVAPAVLPGTATSYTFTFLHPGNQYWFYIFARDSGGKTSATASTTARTLLDTTPPSTAPAVTVDETGSNYAVISWTPPADDSPFFTYEVWVNGSPSGGTGQNVNTTVLRFLQPNTGYSVSVRGRDGGNNWSPFSDPVSVLTLPPNPNDHTPPTTPANLFAYSFDGDTEMQISWSQSTDDFDAQAHIRYDVYVNGVLDDIRFGSGGPIIAYGVHGLNTIDVIASDTAGNRSEVARFMLSLP